MWKTYVNDLLLFTFISLLLFGCLEFESGLSGDNNTEFNSDADSDSDGDSDNDTDADGDTDIETDTQTDDTALFNICEEEVPEEHYVDGIPAYNQCAASENASIFTNNGINTATQEGDGNWVRTQMSSGYQCTEFAKRYMEYVWNVPTVPNGDAGTWCDDAPPEGLVQSDTPVHGDVIVFAPGSCGASEEFGHLAIVDIVHEAENSVEFVEQNYANRRACDINTAACFLHAVSNQ